MMQKPINEETDLLELKHWLMECGCGELEGSCLQELLLKVYLYWIQVTVRLQFVTWELIFQLLSDEQKMEQFEHEMSLWRVLLPRHTWTSTYDLWNARGPEWKCCVGWQCCVSLCVCQTFKLLSFLSHSDQNGVCRAVWRPMFWALRQRLLPSWMCRRLLRPQGHRLFRMSNFIELLYSFPPFSHVAYHLQTQPPVSASPGSPSFLFVLFWLKLLHFVCRLMDRLWLYGAVKHCCPNCWFSVPISVRFINHSLSCTMCPSNTVIL